MTASTSSRASRASRSSVASGTPVRAAISCARARSRLKSATTSPCGWALTPGMCATAAKLAAPRTATRTVSGIPGSLPRALGAPAPRARPRWYPPAPPTRALQRVCTSPLPARIGRRKRCRSDTWLYESTDKTRGLHLLCSGCMISPAEAQKMVSEPAAVAQVRDRAGVPVGRPGGAPPGVQRQPGAEVAPPGLAPGDPPRPAGRARLRLPPGGRRALRQRALEPPARAPVARTGRRGRRSAPERRPAPSASRRRRPRRRRRPSRPSASSPRAWSRSARTAAAAPAPPAARRRRAPPAAPAPPGRRRRPRSPAPAPATGAGAGAASRRRRRRRQPPPPSRPPGARSSCGTATPARARPWSSPASRAEGAGRPSTWPRPGRGATTRSSSARCPAPGRRPASSPSGAAASASRLA